MEEKFDLTVIKALSKEKRQYFAAEVRKDPELWSAVHGLGGISENAEYGAIIGTVFQNKKPLAGASVVVRGGERIELKTTTNQYGFYKFELDKGIYNVMTEIEGKKAEGKEIILENGRTETANFSFEGVVEGEIHKLNLFTIEEESSPTVENATNTVAANTESTNTEVQ